MQMNCAVSPALLFALQLSYFTTVWPILTFQTSDHKRASVCFMYNIACTLFFNAVKVNHVFFKSCTKWIV